MLNSIFDIDYENIIVNKHKILDRTVYTIDNFYKFPFGVLKHFRNMEMPPATSFYPGNRADYNPKTQGEYNATWKHVNDIKLLLAHHGFDYSRFIYNKDTTNDYELLQFSQLVNDVLKTKKYKDVLNADSENSVGFNPHTDAEAFEDDNNLLAGVCYLSRDTHGGTGIYRYRKDGVYCSNQRVRVNSMTSLKEKLEGVSCEVQRSDIMYKFFTDDYNDRMPKKSGLMNKSDEHFELLHLFPMKFNRMVFYEGDLLHSIYIDDENFFIHNERITTNYTFALKWDYEDDDRKKLESKEFTDLREEISTRMTNICQKIPIKLN
jgi:hypothetical protein